MTDYGNDPHRVHTTYVVEHTNLTEGRIDCTCGWHSHRVIKVEQNRMRSMLWNDHLTHLQEVVASPEYHKHTPQPIYLKDIPHLDR